MARRSPIDPYAEALERIEVCRKLKKDGRELYLSGLALTTLPPEIGQLRALTGLYLHGNPLTSLPPEIGQLAALTLLDLRNNQLTDLPPKYGWNILNRC